MTKQIIKEGILKWQQKLTLKPIKKKNLEGGGGCEDFYKNFEWKFWNRKIKNCIFKKLQLINSNFFLFLGGFQLVF